jgi:preprotein translocase subunit SecG
VITLLVVIVHIFVSLALILIVLLQVGKGGSLSAAFGGAGSSQTLFGSRGPATFLSRLTAIMATLFMLTSLGLAYISSHARQRSTIMDQIPATESTPLPMSPPESTPAPTPPAESTPAPPPASTPQQ